MMIEQAGLAAINARKLDLLRRRINDEDYLHAAIQRLALVLSNELMEISSEGGRNERRRKRRK
jgi:hypothetical protein